MKSPFPDGSISTTRPRSYHRFHALFQGVRDDLTACLSRVGEVVRPERLALRWLLRSMFLRLADSAGIGASLPPFLDLSMPAVEQRLPPEAVAHAVTFLDNQVWGLEDTDREARNALGPDLLGYVFERGIEQKEMGAYYTQHDVTDFICQRTLAPHVLEAVSRHGREGYVLDAARTLLREDPDRYLPAAVRSAPEEDDSTQRHHAQIRRKLATGALESLAEVITWNLDGARLAEDVIRRRETASQVGSVWEVMQSIAVLDPTCGAGAFLVAALRVLERLGLACLEKMEQFPRQRAFRSILSRARQEGRRAFLVRSLLTRNLFGVDLMKEAVEVCQLRLLLEWLARVEAPTREVAWPDLQATLQVGDALKGTARSPLTTEGEGWLPPQHQAVAFEEVRARGGFDVIVGNPPYVEVPHLQKEHEAQGYATARCGNLYALVIERARALLSPTGRLGMIVPHSAFCTDRMGPLLHLLTERGTLWVSTYAIRPSKLFAGVDQRLAIFLTAPGSTPKRFTTRYQRWYEEERRHLFDRVRYVETTELRYVNALPRLGEEIETAIWNRVHRHRPLGEALEGQSRIYYHNAPRYWVRALTFAPFFQNERDGEKLSAQVKMLPVADDHAGQVIVAALNSSLFYWWWLSLSDCRHLNVREIQRFPLGLAEMSAGQKAELCELCAALMEDYKRHAVRKVCRYRTTGRVIYDEYFPRHSKPILDAIDRVLARHQGLTEEEVQFVINYDLKYRLGEGLSRNGPGARPTP